MSPTTGSNHNLAMVSPAPMHTAPTSTTASSSSTASATTPVFIQTILFTNDPDIVAKEREHVFTSEEEEDGVVFINENEVLSAVSRSSAANVERPTTSAGRLK